MQPEYSVLKLRYFFPGGNEESGRVAPRLELVSELWSNSATPPGVWHWKFQEKSSDGPVLADSDYSEFFGVMRLGGRDTSILRRQFIASE